MSKKMLSRSILEGGRANSFERRDSMGPERAAARNFAAKCKIDPDLADELVIEEREKVCKEFKDKTACAERWLESHVGLLWDETYSKMREMFDARTTAGRHILFDHLLRDVTPHQWDYHGYGKFVVDDDGILCNRADGRRYRYREKKYPFVVERTNAEVNHWLADRIVKVDGNNLFWMVPGKLKWQICKEYDCKLEHREITDYVIAPVRCRWRPDRDPDVPKMPYKQTHKEHAYSPYGYGQGRKLSEKDEKFWKSLHPKHKSAFTWQAAWTNDPQYPRKVGVSQNGRWNE